MKPSVVVVQKTF